MDADGAAQKRASAHDRLLPQGAGGALDQISVKAALLAASAFLGACAKNSPEWERAVALGRYDVGAPVCQSTGKAPFYPAANYAAALYDFADLTEHTLTVGQNSAI